MNKTSHLDELLLKIAPQTRKKLGHEACLRVAEVYSENPNLDDESIYKRLKKEGVLSESTSPGDCTMVERMRGRKIVKKLTSEELIFMKYGRPKK